MITNEKPGSLVLSACATQLVFFHAMLRDSMRPSRGEAIPFSTWGLSLFSRE